MELASYNNVNKFLLFDYIYVRIVFLVYVDIGEILKFLM